MHSNFLSDDFLSLIFLVAVILFAVKSIREILNEKQTIAEGQNQIQQEPASTDQLIYYGNKPGITDDDINNILDNWQPYYKNLQPFLQQTFQERLKLFMQQKVFVIKDKEGYKEMPVLTSAAAVQITLGLNDFYFSSFSTIEIFPNEFYDETANKILNGEVDGNTITIAWNPFLKGNIDYTDKENVGLHEMAHALYYQKIVVSNDDENFKSYFDEVIKECEKIFNRGFHSQNLFGEYAFKNMQEFWAESVEIFFESPHEMRSSFGALFTILKSLLKQDPENVANPVLSVFQD